MQVLAMCKTTPTLMALLSHAESDAWLSLGLMFYLSAVPLTMQLSNLSGFLWARTLQGNRAQRIEMLLLHEFHRRKFLLPDKPQRGAPVVRGGAKASAALGVDANAAEPDKAPAEPAGKTKGPQYAGARSQLPPPASHAAAAFSLSAHSMSTRL
jgi:DNA polymerase alpha subunit A